MSAGRWTVPPRAIWLANALQHGHAGIDARVALAQIDRLSEVVGTAQPHATVIESARIVALHARSRDDLDLAGMDEVKEHIDRFGAGLDPGSPVRLQAQILSVMQAAAAATARGDLAAVAAEADRMIAMCRDLPATH